MSWNKSEKRLIRPFTQPEAARDAFRGGRITIGTQTWNFDETRPKADPENLTGNDIVIEHALDHAEHRDYTESAGAMVSLILSLRDPIFKKKTVMGRWPVSGDFPETVTIPATAVEEHGHGKCLDVTLALVHEGETKPAPDWPARPGVWVERITFRIRSHKQGRIFDIGRMTVEEAEDKTGFRGSILHVDYNGNINEPEIDKPIARCDIAAAVFDNMKGSGPGKKYLETTFEPEIILAILTAAFQDIKDAEEATPGSQLEGFLSKLGGKRGAMPLAEFQEIIDDPNKLRNLIHDRAGHADKLGRL